MLEETGWPISPQPRSVQAEGFEGGVGVEVGLELREEFAGDGSDVVDAGHGQEETLRARVEGNLQGLWRGLPRVRCFPRGSRCSMRRPGSPNVKGGGGTFGSLAYLQ